MAGPASDVNCTKCNVLILGLEASKSLQEPLCNPQELQAELVPYVLNYSLQSNAFVGLPKSERQLRLKALTQQILSGESGGGPSSESPAYMKEADSGEFGPQRFWAYLRSKYGTLGGHIQETLRCLEAQLQCQRVVVLRFEGESAVPSASLLVRASLPCAPPGSQHEESLDASRLTFDVGSFKAATVSSWLAGATGAVGTTPRAPPLWSRLVDEGKLAAAAGEGCQALLLCTDSESTVTSPKALTIAAHLLMHECEVVPYISSMHIGPQRSERLAALQDFCAWSGGLALNVDQAAMLQGSLQGLASYLFGSGLGERREFYRKKQSLGTGCFLSLPALVETAASQEAASKAPLLATLPGVLMTGDDSSNLDVAVPSDSMAAVLSDVSLALPRRWSRSLRCWREYRGLRDVVFSEPGGLGLELDEPDLTSPDVEKHTWRLRATHPPASSLKIEDQAQLVAVNTMRVHKGTSRGEVAKRVACRPVSLTFRCSSSSADRGNLGLILSMATAEVVVSELREEYPPIKTKEPPLSTALARVAAAAKSASSSDARRLCQAEKVLAVADRQAEASEQHPLVRCSAVLCRVLLFCGSIVSTLQLGLSCSSSCSQLSLASAPLAKEEARHAGEARELQRRLWQWLLRWGDGPSSAQRPGLWRWLRGVKAPSTAASNLLESVLQVTASSEASGLLRLSQGLGGATPGAYIAKQAAETSRGPQPQETLAALLAGPLQGQRLWLLADDSLPWLVRESRAFQVAFAAHCPQLFRHFVGEGLAPELFFCWWFQRLMQGCHGDESSILRIWDLFVLERSNKVFVRSVIAVFKLLEPKLRGDIDQIMKVLFNPQTWALSGSLVTEALGTKVTRSMLNEIAAEQ